MTAPQQELPRLFTANDIAVLTIGSVIGSGIFLVPGLVLRDAGGSVGLALLIWILGGALSYLGALTYAELGAMSPRAGGLYLYIRDAFGPAAAFAYGWTLFAVIGAGTVATLAVATATYLAALFPIGPSTQRLIAVALTLLIALANVPGTKRSARAIEVATWIKVSAIAALVIFLPIAGNGFAEIDAWFPTSIPSGLITSAGAALIAVLWAYEGWQYLTFLAGETKEPQRNFPRGIALGTLGLVAIYVAAAIAYVAGIGPAAVAASDRVAADAVGAVFGAAWGKLIAVAIIISMLSAAQANSLMSARVYYAMARDGLFFSPMGRIHPRYGTPAVALIAGGVWAAVLAASGTFETLLRYVVFVGWVFYGLAALAVVVLRRTRPDAPRPYRVPGYPVTPILFALAGLAIVVNTIVTDPRQAAIGLGATLMAVPVYFGWRALHANKPPTGP
ncbi:MAG: APC family permease [Gemmatimonadales bacterium]